MGLDTEDEDEGSLCFPARLWNPFFPSSIEATTAAETSSSQPLLGTNDKRVVEPIAKIHAFGKHLDTTTVIERAIALFHDSNQVRHNPRQCCTFVAELLYLHHQDRLFQVLTVNEKSTKQSESCKTQLFFGLSKLFESNDAALRRMTLLALKELATLLCLDNPTQVSVLISCLQKEMTCDFDLYRTHAVRVYVSLLLSATTSVGKRDMETIMVTRWKGEMEPYLAIRQLRGAALWATPTRRMVSAMLVSASHVVSMSLSESIVGCSSVAHAGFQDTTANTTTATTTPTTATASTMMAVIQPRISHIVQVAKYNHRYMTQFHAIQLLVQLHVNATNNNSPNDNTAHDGNDQHSTDQALVVNFLENTPSRIDLLVQRYSPLSLIVLIRFTARRMMCTMVEANGEPKVHNGAYSYRQSSIPTVQDGFCFLEANLQHSNAMVVYEAARALCHLSNASLDDVTAAIWTLHHLASSMSSTRTTTTRTVRTATLRCLAAVAEQRPDAV